MFLSATAVTKLQGELHQRDVKYTGRGVENSPFLTEIAVYIENGTR